MTEIRGPPLSKGGWGRMPLKFITCTPSYRCRHGPELWRTAGPAPCHVAQHMGDLGAENARRGVDAVGLDGEFPAGSAERGGAAGIGEYAQILRDEIRRVGRAQIMPAVLALDPRHRGRQRDERQAAGQGFQYLGLDAGSG